jgi:hypothetical protein
MSYSENNRWKSTASTRLSLFSNHEEPSFSTNSSSSVANSHLNKTLSKLIDRFDITHDNQNPHEIQRQKDRLLDKYNNTLLT